MASELFKISKPAWYARLEAGDIVPPPPDGGWSRWWREYDGYVWLIIVAGAIGLVFNLISAAGEKAIRS